MTSLDVRVAECERLVHATISVWAYLVGLFGKALVAWDYSRVGLVIWVDVVNVDNRFRTGDPVYLVQAC